MAAPAIHLDSHGEARTTGVASVRLSRLVEGFAAMRSMHSSAVRAASAPQRPASRYQALQRRLQHGLPPARSGWPGAPCRLAFSMIVYWAA